MTISEQWKRVTDFPIEYRHLAMVSVQRLVDDAADTYLYYCDAHDWAAVLPAEVIPKVALHDGTVTYAGFEDVGDGEMIGIVSSTDFDQFASFLSQFRSEAVAFDKLTLIGLLASSDEPDPSFPKNEPYQLGPLMGEFYLMGVLGVPYRFALYSITKWKNGIETEMRTLPQEHFEEGDNLAGRENWFKRRSGSVPHPSDKD